jgi:hypothetical protein
MNLSGTQSTSLNCKSTGGNYPNGTDVGSPCFQRDLIMVQNFVAPAEQIEFDSSIQRIFSSVLGTKTTLISIRESKNE